MQRFKMYLPGAALLMLLAGLLAACNHGNDDNPGPNGNPPAAGTWRISYFYDKQDETSNYAGYTFEFGSSGALTATQGGQTWSGSWSTGFDDSHNKFLIDFNGNPPSALLELEEDWHILEQTDDLMHFEHTSGGNGDTDVVKFVRD